MEEVGLSDVISRLSQAFEAGQHDQVEELLYPALDQYPGVAPLWFFAGNVNFRLKSAAMALACYNRSNELETNPHVMANMAACYRRLNLTDLGIVVAKRALTLDPNCLPALVNLGGMSVNEGDPGPGIQALEKALPLTEEHAARWNLGLLYLEAGRFAEGFDLYASGRGYERLIRTYPVPGRPEPILLEPEHERAGKTLVVWGEQGIGDELMFGTLLEEARQDFGRVILDCHPRLARLHATAHPTIELRPTRKLVPELATWPAREDAQIDYKAPIGDLARLYRRSPGDFKPARRIEANRQEALGYRQRLVAHTGDRKLIGLAMRGGVISTARLMRSVRMEDLEPLFEQTDACFVSLDYEDMSALATQIQERYGRDRFHWFPSILYAWDYDHTAALVAATDMTVTVCQSVAHLSALMGHPTRVLTPTRVAWRYGLEGESWYWYPGADAKLYRQERGDSWARVVAKVVADINQLERRTWP